MLVEEQTESSNPVLLLPIRYNMLAEEQTVFRSCIASASKIQYVSRGANKSSNLVLFLPIRYNMLVEDQTVFKSCIVSANTL